ncbi:hypothetical protein ACJDU8_01060 [Clostridium sp. WILCCON 0269]|uniref:Uncharacterized protein n=1 Tax=Candidatus Clostridium eludens TaxID=3381663 RepID=A0ABW8SG76_9CLOT
MTKLSKTVESKQSINTRKEIADIAGVSEDTIHKVKVIEDKGSEELKEQLKNKKAKSGCQISDKAIDTKKELAQIA